MPTESVELVIVPELETSKELAVLNPESRLTLKQVFTPFFVDFKTLQTEASEIAVNAPVAARAMRLKLRKVRVACDKARKQAGEDAMTYKKSVDGIYKLLESNLDPIETRMEGIERAEQIAAQEKANALKTKRLAELLPFGQDNTFYDLANLPEMQYQQLLGSQQVAHEAKQAAIKKEADDRAAAEQARLKRETDLAAENARLAAETKVKQKALDDAKRAADEIAKKAEADRKAALDKLAAETARLKADADAKLAAQVKAATDEAARIKKVADDKAAKDAADRATAEKAAQAERDKAKAAQDKVTVDALAKADAATKRAFEEAQKLFEANEIRQKALRDKATQEREAQALVVENARKAAAAPDKEKLLTFAQTLRDLYLPIPSSPAAQVLMLKIRDQGAKFANWVVSEANKL